MSRELDLIDQIISRTNCSYKEANDALTQTGGDVVESIVLIEAGKFPKNTTSSGSQSKINSDATSDTSDHASDASNIKMEWKSEVFKAQLKFIGATLVKLFKKLMQMKIAWQKDNKILLELPLLIVILIAWFTLPFSLIVLVIPFFLGINVLLKTNGKKDKDISHMIKAQFDDKEV